MVLLHKMQGHIGQDTKSLKMTERLQVMHERLEAKMNAYQAKTEAKHQEMTDIMKACLEWMVTNQEKVQTKTWDTRTNGKGEPRTMLYEEPLEDGRSGRGNRRILKATMT